MSHCIGVLRYVVQRHDDPSDCFIVIVALRVHRQLALSIETMNMMSVT